MNKEYDIIDLSNKGKGVNMREEIETALFKMSKEFENKLFEEFYPSARDREERDEIKEKALKYYKIAILSAYFRYECERLGKKGWE